ncbi:AAA family ATPase [Tsukamurella tyrosinosolvens]|uniref:AAA family ATPase n=1 Tax=Tsukamurella tyrosinosolvens TaxID=57704 RepID=UPI002DD42C8F|nr:ATP-binding protein [Tsukamurella tyrosinosolvens]MEC4612793.1 ATP-binding protein [Tsukamurella tyrosinosolvens]
MWDGGVFEPQIRYIRFPRFKNLATNLQINFDYPITALVGPNGCNKTAILRALQGAPRGNDLGNYWFGTAVDEISSEERHRFIYGRKSDTVGGDVEVVKTRIGRRRSKRSAKEIDPDLFEPSRPLTSAPDGMDPYPFVDQTPPIDGSETRWKAISKQVEYLDFRSQISAFDWILYHGETSTDSRSRPLTAMRARKNAIRRKSARLAAAINSQLSSDVYYGVDRIVSPIEELSLEAHQWVERILGKQFKSIRVVQHKYFRPTGGWTVLLHSNDLRYSEAFAGSGEFAAVMLVVRVLSAKSGALILLDEPEVSLHPAAQRELATFLLDVAKKRKHQIVFATHSPDMLRQLPPEAIKKMSIRNDDGLVDIATQASPARVAFESIGAEYQHLTIVVEDRLAKFLVEKALADSDYAPLVDVKFIAGGASTLWSHYVPMWAHEGRRNLLLLLDGDQDCLAPPPCSEIAESDLEHALLDSFNRVSAKLPYGRDEENSQENRRESINRTLDWRRSFVRFLPCITPEEFVWRTSGRTCEGVVEFKQAWREYVASLLGSEPDGDDIFFAQRVEVNAIDHNNAVLVEIRGIVEEFVGEVEA